MAVWGSGTAVMRPPASAKPPFHKAKKRKGLVNGAAPEAHAGWALSAAAAQAYAPIPTSTSRDLHMHTYKHRISYQRVPASETREPGQERRSCSTCVLRRPARK